MSGLGSSGTSLSGGTKDSIKEIYGGVEPAGGPAHGVAAEAEAHLGGLWHSCLRCRSAQARQQRDVPHLRPKLFALGSRWRRAGHLGTDSIGAGNQLPVFLLPLLDSRDGLRASRGRRGPPVGGGTQPARLLPAGVRGGVPGWAAPHPGVFHLKSPG